MPDPTPFETGLRPPLEVAAEQMQVVRQHPAAPLLEAVQVPLMVLNSERQIVFANTAALAVMGAEDEWDVCGLRPGEALECVNARESQEGCGGSPACRACGQLRAVLESQAGRAASELCHLTRRQENGEENPVDLRVRTCPVDFGGEWHTLVTYQEVTDTIRREVLERTLFEDVARLTQQFEQMAAWLRPEAPEEMRERAAGVIAATARQLRGLVARQETLAAAERGRLRPVMGSVNSVALLRGAAAAAAEGGTAAIVLDPGAESVEFRTDRNLAGMVLRELLANALEASNGSGHVSAGCRLAGGRLEFRVANAGVVPPTARARMFRRSVSTKGPGRGIGTYLAKTLAERYLGGAVSFRTGDQGTAFTAAFPEGS